MERSAFDRMAEIDGEHWWFVARRGIVARLLKRHLPSRPLRILEIGCGTGSNIPMLREFGSVEAIEPDDQARAIAIERTGAAIRGGLLPDGVELPERAYDLIVLLDVLEHIPDDVGALQGLRSKLAPGGTLVLTVPAMPWLWSAHDVAHHHQRRYTPKKMREALAGGGFRLRHSGHFNSLLFPLIVAARAVGRITGREGGDDAMPSPAVNAVLKRVFGAEKMWIGRVKVPFGVSLAAVAEPVSFA